MDESCTHCGMMTISELRSILQLLQRGGVPVLLPRSNPPQRVSASGDTGDLRITVSAFPSGNQPPRKPHSSCTPQPAELPEERGGPSQRCAPSVSFSTPLDDRMSIAASEGESDFAGDDASAQLSPSGTVAVPDTDPEMMAMLSRAANRVGLMWNHPPCPEPSRLDDWFLGVARAGSQPPTPVPFFPEVHEELTGTWKAPFTARNRASGPSSLTTLNGGAAKGYTRIPPVERAVTMQLCPNSTWRGEPSLPSRACEHSSDLTGRAYQACGEAASALHAMALLQVHQAKALRDLHEGGHDPQVHHELRAATDLALRGTKVTARAVGRAMSTLVVQERHLWLCLADMRDTDKVRFLNSPVSQTGLFGDAVENFAQQFSAVQKQSEAISHILPRRSAVASTLPPAAPQPARRRGRPPATAPAPAPQQQPPPKRRRGASRKRGPQPVQAPAKRAAKPRARGPRTGDPEMIGTALQEMVTAPLLPPEEGRVVNPLFFPSVLPLAQQPAVPKFSRKEQFLSSPGPKRARRVVGGAKPLHSHPPLLSPADSSAQFEMGTQASPAPPVRPWNQVSVAQHTQTPLRAASQREPPEPRPCVPPRCPTAGTPVVPLVPLVRSLRAWLVLPSPSRWLIRTIRLGYAIQFARRPPKFRGVHFTSVKAVDTHVLRAEIAVLLAKVPKKSGGLRPILDLQVLNRGLHKLPFKMLTQFLRFAFEGRAYQYKILPFGLALSPHVFRKVVEGALVPMREQGVRILNYLDDWLILTQSREQLCEHRDLVLSHLSKLGLQVSWEKSKLAPGQRISFLGMELDSVEQSARLTEERAQLVLNCLNTFRGRTAVPLKLFQRLLGHMAAAAAVTPLSLLHMRPLQHWLHGRVPSWAWQRGTYRVAITPECRQTFSPWSDPLFLRAGVALEQVSRHAVVFTDASATGWGATCNGQAVSGVWTGPQRHWHINCLELLAVYLALGCLKGPLRGKHVLVRTDNTATVAYINRQGGLRSHRMSPAISSFGVRSI